MITQGPYGTFSHWGNSLHAFDIAPRSGRCVVAMKAGVAYTHDLGLHQDHRHRIFRQLHYDRPWQRRVQPLRASGHRHLCGGERPARGARTGARHRGKQRLHAGRRRRVSRPRQRDARRWRFRRQQHSISVSRIFPMPRAAAYRTVVSANASPFVRLPRAASRGPIARATTSLGAAIFRTSFGRAMVERDCRGAQRSENVRRRLSWPGATDSIWTCT